MSVIKGKEVPLFSEPIETITLPNINIEDYIKGLTIISKDQQSNCITLLLELNNQSDEQMTQQYKYSYQQWVQYNKKFEIQFKEKPRIFYDDQIILYNPLEMKSSFYYRDENKIYDTQNDLSQVSNIFFEDGKLFIVTSSKEIQYSKVTNQELEEFKKYQLEPEIYYSFNNTFYFIKDGSLIYQSLYLENNEIKFSEQTILAKVNNLKKVVFHKQCILLFKDSQVIYINRQKSFIIQGSFTEAIFEPEALFLYNKETKEMLISKLIYDLYDSIIERTNCEDLIKFQKKRNQENLKLTKTFENLYIWRNFKILSHYNTIFYQKLSEQEEWQCLHLRGSIQSLAQNYEKMFFILIDGTNGQVELVEDSNTLEVKYSENKIQDLFQSYSNWNFDHSYFLIECFNPIKRSERILKILDTKLQFSSLNFDSNILTSYKQIIKVQNNENNQFAINKDSQFIFFKMEYDKDSKLTAVKQEMKFLNWNDYYCQLILKEQSKSYYALEIYNNYNQICFEDKFERLNKVKVLGHSTQLISSYIYANLDDDIIVFPQNNLNEEFFIKVAKASKSSIFTEFYDKLYYIVEEQNQMKSVLLPHSSMIFAKERLDKILAIEQYKNKIYLMDYKFLHKYDINNAQLIEKPTELKIDWIRDFELECLKNCDDYSTQNNYDYYQHNILKKKLNLEQEDISFIIQQIEQASGKDLDKQNLFMYKIIKLEENGNVNCLLTLIHTELNQIQYSKFSNTLSFFYGDYLNGKQNLYKIHKINSEISYFEKVNLNVEIYFDQYYMMPMVSQDLMSVCLPNNQLKGGIYDLISGIELIKFPPEVQKNFQHNQLWKLPFMFLNQNQLCFRDVVTQIEKIYQINKNDLELIGQAYIPELPSQSEKFRYYLREKLLFKRKKEDYKYLFLDTRIYYYEKKEFISIYNNTNLIDELCAIEFSKNCKIGNDFDEELVRSYNTKFYPNGNTLLHYFVNNPGNLKDLLTFCKKKNISLLFIPNFDNKTPLHISLEKNMTQSTNLLLEHLTTDAFPIYYGNFISDIIGDLLKTKNMILPKFLDSRLTTSTETLAVDFGELQQTTSPCSMLPYSEEITSTMIVSEGKDPIQLEVQFLDLPYLHSWETDGVGEQFLREISEYPDLQILTSKAIGFIIEYKWPIFKKQIIKWLVIPYFFYLITFVLFSSYYSKFLQDAFATTISIIVMCFSAYFLLHESFQVKQEGFNYLFSFWNYIDMIPILLVPSCLILQVFDMVSFDYMRLFVAVSTMLVWFKLLYFLRVFEQTGYLIRIIIEVLKDMTFFLIVLMATLCAFGNAFYVISMGNTDDNDKFVPNLIMGFVFTYQIILGDFDTEKFGQVQVLFVWILFLACTVINSIIMLNLLIAIISDSFERIQLSQEQAQLHQKVQLMVDTFYLIPSKYKKTLSLLESYLLIGKDLDIDASKGKEKQKKVTEVINTKMESLAKADSIEKVKASLIEKITKLEEKVEKLTKVEDKVEKLSSDVKENQNKLSTQMDLIQKQLELLIQSNQMTPKKVENDEQIIQIQT